MRETVYLGRDNTIELELKEHKALLTSGQMDAITQAAIYYQGQVYDSDTHAGAFDWITKKDKAIIILDLGSLPLPIGMDTKAKLIIFDADNTDGIVWQRFTLEVIQA